MSDKRESDTLEQQRKARQEFLKLKKMQNGEMGAGPKPSEVAINPKTASEKLKNIWFHDKWFIVATVIIALTIAFVAKQCANKVEFDATVVLYTYSPTGDSNCSLMADYFEPLCEDINDDGEVNINVVNCSFNQYQPNSQETRVAREKMQGIIATDPNALLFITDAKSYDYFFEISNEIVFFEGEPLTLGDDFYESCKTDDIFDLPENMQISCRNISGAVIGKDKNIEKYYNQAQSILKALEEKSSH